MTDWFSFHHNMENVLTKWLKKYCPSELERYEKYTGDSLQDVYFSDLSSWMSVRHDDVLAEFFSFLLEAVEKS